MPVATPSPAHLLVVDDHRKIRDPLATYLRRHGHQVDTAEDAATMWRQFKVHRYDAIVLDVMLPDGDGFSLCRQLQEHHGVLVILLTARGEVQDRVKGLDLGADDYLVKPFEPRELLARINALLRRSAASSASLQTRMQVPLCYRFQERVYRPDLGTVSLSDGVQVRLTSSQARLLEVFLNHARQVLPRERLLAVTCGDQEIFDRSIDRQICRLRRKIDGGCAASGVLRTVWGEGYGLFAEVVVEWG